MVSAALRMLRALVAAATGSSPPRDLQAALADLLPVLVDKAADLNQRTREQTTEALVALGGVPAAGLAGATAAFLRPVKPNTAWKVVFYRCGGGWWGTCLDKQTGWLRHTLGQFGWVAHDGANLPGHARVRSVPSLVLSAAVALLLIGLTSLPACIPIHPSAGSNSCLRCCRCWASLGGQARVSLQRL